MIPSPDIFESLPDGVQVLAPDGPVLSINAAGLRLLDAESVEDLQNGPFFSRLIEEHQSAFLGLTARVLCGESGTLEVDVETLKGNRRRLEISASSVRDEVGNVVAVLCIARDVSERWWAEQALRTTNARLRNFVDNATDAFFIHDSTGRLHDVNPQACESLGYTREELIGMRPEDWDPDVNEAFSLDLRARLNRGETVSIQRRHLRKDGTSFPVEVRLRPFWEGTERFSIGLARDISERLQIEEQLRQAQKMDAIGQLAGGVAHDFNNIITGVLIEAELTGMAPGLPAEALTGLQEIRGAAERAGNLTRQLLHFSRRQLPQPRELDLNSSVPRMSRMLRRLIGQKVSVRMQLCEAPLVVLADAGMVDQVLMNLAMNARDAMPAGGEIAIATEEVHLNEAEVHDYPGATPGRFVCLSVSDTGSGIAPAVLPRIFELFFTTKASGKGTGLGLATVSAIVKQHRGVIRVESEPDRGTKFRVYFPASDGEAHAPDHVDDRLQGGNGTEKILLVEDEPSVRSAAAKLLVVQGYQLVAACTGADALKLWPQHRDTIALLVTDLAMPGGVNGRELALQLLVERPDLKVLFTSGYSAELVDGQLDLSPGQSFLHKPFHPKQLLQAIRQCLDT